ncbi:MAG: M48 family metallopeptidase, partial [Chloroherpetonaceae bacterium]
LREVKSYPELAALLGHEYAHIKNRHGMKNLAHAVSRELLTAILAGSDRSNTLISNSNKLLTLKNSRELENEADKGGLELLIQNRIDGNGMAQMLRRIEKLGQKSGKNIPAYLSTHPDIEDRIETIEEEIKRGKNDYIHREELERLFQQLIAVSK